MADDTDIEKVTFGGKKKRGGEGKGRGRGKRRGRGRERPRSWLQRVAVLCLQEHPPLNVLSSAWRANN